MPQQHRGGHGTEGQAAFGHTTDDVLHLVHSHIAAQGPGIIFTDADINENGTFRDMAAADQAGLAGRGHH